MVLNRFRKSSWSFSVFNCALEMGLSFWVCGLLKDRVAALTAALRDLATGGTDAKHRADRAQIDSSSRPLK
jgi:hypothetical protein